jgi:DNA-binding GntR family transcriptional regulator
MDSSWRDRGGSKAASQEKEVFEMKIRSLADHASQYLEDGIIKGSFHPGQQIKEEQVASHLGFSRPPIREAFKMLEAQGLITRKPNRGVFVSKISGQDIWEIYTLKLALYELSTRLAFDKMAGQGMRKLEKVVERMETCVNKATPDNLTKYQDLNESFHDVIIDITGHQRLKRIVASLHNQVKRFSYQSLANEKHYHRSFRYHRMIFEAIRDGDRELAERLTREHILKGMEVAMKVVASD